MKTHNNYWLKLFTVFIFTFLFSHVYAVQIDLNGTITKINGDGNSSTCHVGDEFILKNTTSYNGIPFDLKLTVTAEKNEGDVLTEDYRSFIKRPCIGINNGLVELILRDMPDENGVNDTDNAASMDIEITTVRGDNQEPLTVNSLLFTAFDLDWNSITTTSTDDIYMSSPGRAFKDANESNVTISNGNFGNGFDIKIKGREGRCNDSVTNPEPECRVSGVVELNNTVSTLKIRIQNDNAYGTLLTDKEYYNAAYRLTQISFQDIVGLGIDHGDMPDSYGDAYNDINITTILGKIVADREEFVPSINADSDDANIDSDTYDDEDAVSIIGQEQNATFTVSQGRSYDFNVTTTGMGYLSAWIDLNNNGSFDAGEKLIDDRLIEDATLSTVQTIIPITIPATAQSGKSYVRFRFSQNQGVAASGNGGKGEVEDYVINIGGAGSLSGHVYDDKNGNGVQDAGEPNLANVTVNVTDTSGGTIPAETTDASGNYLFNAVATGDTNVTIDETTLPAGVKQTEGTNPTTVTIVGSTATVEENNGFQRQVDLKTEKSVDNQSPKEGATIVYTLRVENSGPSEATNVSLTDTLPAGVTYVSDTGAGAYVSATGKWTVPTLASGEHARLDITATVNNGTSGQSITNITTAASTPDANDTTPGGDDLNETITVGGKPTVTISDVTVVEGNDLVFDVNLSEASNSVTTINIVTEDNTATAGQDYVALTTTTVTIPAGQTSAKVTVTSNDDTVYEPTAETFDLKGEVTSANTQNTDPSAVGTITDNDTKPTVTITGPNGGDARVEEGNPLVFDINLSNPTTEDIVIDLSTVNGTALSGEDYNATTGQVTIDAETTGTTFTVVTIDDLIDEVDYEENITLNGTVSSGEVSNPTVVGTGIILDNDVNATDDNATGEKGEAVTIDVLANDGNDLNASSVRLVDANGTAVTTLEVPGQGKWDVNTTTGKVTFTPNADFVGNPTPVTYTVKDNAGNTSNPAKITVTYPPAEVQAVDDNATGETGEAVTIDVLANDRGDAPLNPKSVKIIDPTTGNPVTELVVPNEGKWIVSQDGKITFVPNNGFTGNPTPIKYTVEDILGNPSNQATVTVRYPNSNTVAGDDNTTTEVGDEAVINLLNNDTDRENDINASSVSLQLPTNLDGNATDTDGDGDIDKIVVPGEGTWSVDEAGVVTFIPDNGFTADPTPIKYTVQDDEGNISNPADIIVNVLQQLHDDSRGAPAGTTIVMNILENDDAVVANTVSLQVPADPSVSATPDDRDSDGYIDEIRVDGEGIWTVDNNGTLTFVPESTFTGNPTPITYTAQDNTGHTLKPATVTIVYSTHTTTPGQTVYVDRPYGVPYPVTVNNGGGKKPVEPPVAGLGEVQAIDDNASFCEGTSLVFNAAANDTYADATFNLINPETNAPMKVGERLTLEYGSVTMNKDGVFTYTPFPETLTIDAVMEEHFTYRLINVKGQQDTAKVYICIACCPETSDSVDALSSVGIVTLLLMFGTLGLYFVRKEEEANI